MTSASNDATPAPVFETNREAFIRIRRDHHILHLALTFLADNFDRVLQKDTLDGGESILDGLSVSEVLAVADEVWGLIEQMETLCGDGETGETRES